MSESILVALISGAISLIGIVISYKAATVKVQHQLETQMALLKQEMQTIKEDVKEHNHYAKLFAETKPVCQEQIKVINHRIADLEKRG